MATGQELGRLQGHAGWVGSLVFWPDGKTLASASADQTIRVWDLPSRTCTDVLRGHCSEVWRLALLPDNRTLVSGAKDGTVCLWDTSVVHPRQQHLVLNHKIWTWCFDPDGRTILTVDFQGQVARWSGRNFQMKEPLLAVGKMPASLEYVWPVARPTEQCPFGMCLDRGYGGVSRRAMAESSPFAFLTRGRVWWPGGKPTIDCLNGTSKRIENSNPGRRPCCPLAEHDHR